MFAPAAGVSEDQVCGSAHCLSGPYWATAKNAKNTPISAIHVSERGGKLGLTVGEEHVKLRGEAIVFARGELLL
jgi:predicted PhzF superfamily epimerase YddE/YHI9